MFLEIKGIKKHYGEGESRVEVLNGIDIEVNKGEIVVLLGPSGSGKSTLLNIIGGIDQPDSGTIMIQGKTISTLKEKDLTNYRRNHLGYVFQMYNLISHLNVEQNIDVGKYLSKNPLDKEEFFEYIQDNFSLDSTSEKLVKNILNFVEMNYPEEKEQYNVLRYFLNDIPGLTDAEIRKVYL